MAVLAVTGLAALLLQPALASSDVSFVATGTTTLKVPGIGTCASPTYVNLRTSGADFVFTGSILGGQGGSSPTSQCAEVNLHSEMSDRKPAVDQCAVVPVIGPDGVVDGPAKFAVVTKVTRKHKVVIRTKYYDVTWTAQDCAGNKLVITHQMTISGSNIGYTFSEYVNKHLVLIATGTLSRAPAVG